MRLKIIFFLLCCAVTLANAQDLASGLLAHYRFSGNANDAGPAGNDGSPVNLQYVSNRFGLPNAAASFNGTAFVNIGQIKPDPPFSISFWFKPNSYGEATQTIFINDEATCPGNYSGTKVDWMTENYTSNPKRLLFSTYNGGVCSPASRWGYFTNSLVQSEWHHVVITYKENRESTIYVNGQFQTTYHHDGTSSGDIVYTTTMDGFLGKRYPDYNNDLHYYTGLLDEFRIYNRPLESSEIELLNNQYAPEIRDFLTDADTVGVNDPVAASFTVTDEDGTECQTQIDWGDGTITAFSDLEASGHTFSFTHNYANPGGYEVRVRVKDQLGETGNWSNQGIVTVQENANPPFVKFNSLNPVQLVRGNPTTLEVYGFDPDNHDVQVRVDWGDGITDAYSALDVNGTLFELRHIFWSDGIFEIRAQAKDQYGRESVWKSMGSVEVTSSANAPTAEFTFTPESGESPLSVQFVNMSSGSISQYLWDFGDGTTSALTNPVHEYVIPGQYSVTLTVSGQYGKDRMLKTNCLTVSNPNDTPQPPVAVVRTNLSEVLPLRYGGQLFVRIDVNDPNFDQCQIKVDWGDGNIDAYTDFQASGTYFDLRHQYWQAGTFDLRIKTRDDTGLERDWGPPHPITVLPQGNPGNTPPIMGDAIADFSFINTRDFQIELDSNVVDQTDDVASLTWQVEADSAQLDISLENRVVRFTAPDWQGSTEVRFTVTDAGGLQHVRRVTALVLEQQPPQILSPDMVFAYTRQPFAYQALATDPEGAEVIFTFTEFPDWLSVAGATLSGTVPRVASDTSFVLTASDGEKTARQTVTLRIINTNRPPEITSPAAIQAVENQPFSYLPQATDPDGDDIVFRLKNEPQWLILSEGMVMGIPPSGLETATFTVIADDGLATDSLDVQMTILSGNHPPMLVSPNTAAAYEDSLFTYTAEAIDPDNDALTFEFTGYPAWLTPQNTRLQGWLPEFAEATDFTVLVSDGLLHDTLNVQLAVHHVNDAPQINRLADFTFPHDGYFAVVLDTCADDADHDTAVLSWTVSCNDAQLTIATHENVTIFSVNDFLTETDVRFVVRDPEGLADSMTVHVEITYPASVDNDATIKPDEFSLSQNYPNPFNPETTIVFSLPQSGDIRLEVYDAAGRRTASLANGHFAAGYHAVTWRADNAASGIYYFKLITADVVKTRKCVLLK